MQYIVNAELSDAYPPYWKTSLTFDSLLNAKEYVAKNFPEHVLCNDNENCAFGYRCRYLWGGYPEGTEVFIVEKK